MGDWTTETLREYILMLINANEAKHSERFEASQTAVNRAFASQQTAVEAALTAQKLSVEMALGAADRAVLKAEVATEKRFESVNEFRAALSDLQSTFMPRLETMALLTSLDDKMSAIQRNYESKLDAQRFSMEKMYESLSKEISGLRESRSEAGGQRTSMRDAWGYIIAAVGILIALSRFLPLH